jgi:hypothetical protein
VVGPAMFGVVVAFFGVAFFGVTFCAMVFFFISNS